MTVALAVAPADRARPRAYMVSVMQDDNQLVYGDLNQRRQRPERDAGPRGRGGPRDAALEGDRTARLGGSRAGFNGANPARLPAASLGSLRLARIRGAQRAGSPSTSTPRARARGGRTRGRASRRRSAPTSRTRSSSASSSGPRGGATAARTATRTPAQVLPRVSWWAIWNEPNQPGWLTPQSEKKRGVGMVAAAPHLYRELLVAGAKGLLATGHANDLLLFARARPARKRDQKPNGDRPVTAARALPARDVLPEPPLPALHGPRSPGARLRQRGEPSRARALPAPRASATTRTRGRPRRESARRSRDMHEHRQRRARCRARSTRSRGRTGLIPRDTADLLHGVRLSDAAPRPVQRHRLERQAEYVNDAEFIAWRHPRVFSHAQFQLYDVPPRTEFPRRHPGLLGHLPVRAVHGAPRGRAEARRQRVQVRPCGPAPGPERADLGPGEVRAKRRDIPHRDSAARPGLVRRGSVPAIWSR